MGSRNDEGPLEKEGEKSEFNRGGLVFMGRRRNKFTED